MLTGNWKLETGNSDRQQSNFVEFSLVKGLAVNTSKVYYEVCYRNFDQLMIALELKKVSDPFHRC